MFGRRQREHEEWMARLDLLIELQQRQHEELVSAVRTLSYIVSRFSQRPIGAVSLPEKTNKAIDRFVSTAIDMQGLIEMIARYLVWSTPDEVFADQEPPEEWKKMSPPEGTVK